MKKKSKRLSQNTPGVSSNYSISNHITFSEPEPVAWWGSYNDMLFNGYGGYYTPPIERADLVKLSNTCSYHGAILRARINMITNGYKGGILTRTQMHAAVFNFLLFGDCGILKIRNGFGKINHFAVLPSLYLRRNGNNETIMTEQPGNDIIYRKNDVIFCAQYDPQQQIYGIPDYMHGMESAMLNVHATRFRIKYYKNGAHMGYILFTSDPDMDAEFESAMRDQITNSKGAGNFKSMFINIPGAEKDAVKVIPIGDTGTKDDFSNVKNVTAQDQLVAHRFPPGLAGIIPENTGGFGDPLKSRVAYINDEIIPVRQFLMESINSDEETGRNGKIMFDITPADMPSDSKGG